MSWGTTALRYSRETFLLIQLLGVLFFALTIPIAAVLAERGRRVTLIWVTVGISLFGLVMAPMFAAGPRRCDADDGARTVADGADLRTARHRAVGTLSDGGALHRQLADVQLRGNLRRVAGAVHRDLAGDHYGLQYVGYYLSTAAALSLVGLLATRETKDQRL